MELVSCITPCHRVSDYENIIRNYVRQTYKNKELVIVLDEGMPEILISDWKGIKVLYSKKGATVGEKRNTACSAARGSIIVHLDSDDVYSHDWVDNMVLNLEDERYNITGLSSALFHVKSSGDNYRYNYNGWQAYVLGATMVYRRKMWEGNKFRDISEGEDAMFLANAGLINVSDNINGFMAVISGNNTCSHKALKDMVKIV